MSHSIMWPPFILIFLKVLFIYHPAFIYCFYLLLEYQPSEGRFLLFNLLMTLPYAEQYLRDCGLSINTSEG